MAGPIRRQGLSAALEAEAARLGAALVILTVQIEGRWWILAASSPHIAGHPDPLELWSASTGGPDAGRTPAIICEVLGQRPGLRWVSEGALSPEVRLAVYWVADQPVEVDELAGVRDRIVQLASPASAPAWGAAEPAILAQIVESLPVALIFIDCSGMSVAANGSARTLLGLRPVDMTPRTVARRLEELGLREAVPDNIPPSLAAASIRVDGRQYSATAQAAHGDWGHGVVWRIEDVTQPRLAEAKLEEAKRMLLLTEVSGGIGHEFNNLLSRVMGVAEDIQEESESSRIHELAETLIETAERGASVVRRLMTFAGSVAPDLALVDLRELVMSWRADQKASDLGADDGDCSSQVLVDATLLRACLDELLKNARQADASWISVRCRWSEDDQMWALSVVDDGVGMAAATLARATQPFFTTRAVGQGVGLGLSMVRGALNQWGGRLNIVSEPGKGTTVTLLLPPLGAVRAAAL